MAPPRSLLGHCLQFRLKKTTRLDIQVNGANGAINPGSHSEPVFLSGSTVVASLQRGYPGEYDVLIMIRVVRLER